MSKYFNYVKICCNTLSWDYPIKNWQSKKKIITIRIWTNPEHCKSNSFHNNFCKSKKFSEQSRGVFDNLCVFFFVVVWPQRLNWVFYLHISIKQLFSHSMFNYVHGQLLKKYDARWYLFLWFFYFPFLACQSIKFFTSVALIFDKLFMNGKIFVWLQKKYGNIRYFFSLSLKRRISDQIFSVSMHNNEKKLR